MGRADRYKLSAIAGGDDDLATLARGTIAELHRRAPHVLADAEATQDIFHKAWERFTVKFDPERNCAPATYMHWCIRYAIHRYYQSAQQYRPWCLSEVFGRQFNGDALGRMALRREGGICVKINPDDRSAVENAAETGELRGYLEAALAYLKPRTARCIRRRYFQGMSLREVGAAEGISHERARQVINAGLKRMRFRYIQCEEAGACEASSTFVPDVQNAVEKAARS